MVTTGACAEKHVFIFISTKARAPKNMSACSSCHVFKKKGERYHSLCSYQKSPAQGNRVNQPGAAGLAKIRGGIGALLSLTQFFVPKHTLTWRVTWATWDLFKTPDRIPFRAGRRHFLRATSSWLWVWALVVLDRPVLVVMVNDFSGERVSETTLILLRKSSSHYICEVATTRFSAHAASQLHKEMMR